MRQIHIEIEDSIHSDFTEVLRGGKKQPTIVQMIETYIKACHREPHLKPEHIIGRMVR